MRQVKRLFYIILLNIIISAITVIAVLQWWDKNHPPISAESTPVTIIITTTQSIDLPVITNSSAQLEVTPFQDGLPVIENRQPTSTLAMLTYRIKEGDTLGALAAEFNLRVSDILAVNDLLDPDMLVIGDIIYIPTAPLPDVTATPTPTLTATPTLHPTATITHGPVPSFTATPVGQAPQVVIDTVIGAGVLENERVVLRRTGDGVLLLSGWRLEDGSGHTYIFPMLTLYKDGAVNLNTRSGQDTVVDLFWGLASPIWSSGKIVSLYDGQNTLRSTYAIP